MCEEDFADARIVMLAVPTEPKRLPLDGDAPWRIIAHVTPHSLRLTTEGLDELKRLLRQFVTPGSPQGAVVDALKSLSHRPKRLWLQGEPMPSLVPGLEVTLAVDERAFSVASLSAFIGAMERFFALYVHENDFVELVVLSANTGAVIRRCEARAGTIPVV